MNPLRRLHHPELHLIEPLENRIAPAIVTGSLYLSSLDSAHGFKITGAAAGDYAGDRGGAAGDVNGDGIADLIIGAANAEGNTGAAYVVAATIGGVKLKLTPGAANDTTGIELGPTPDFVLREIAPS
jgi:FG-GAP repeat